jgi:hypothetical protein
MNAQVFTGIELLLSMVDRLAAARTVLRQAHAEGRQANAAELTAVRAEGAALLSDLDAAIARAKAEGR